MSATGRSDVRQKDDFYATPAWATLAILPHLKAKLPTLPKVLDPCCGSGAIFQVVCAHWATCFPCGIELDQHRALMSSAILLRGGHPNQVWGNRDALAMTWGVPDLILTNPPYKIALEFVEKALLEASLTEDVNVHGRIPRHEKGVPQGVVAMLLRLPWLASQKRAAFLRKNTPSVYVLSRRPSFTGQGTDATDYAWMVWGPGFSGDDRKVHILDLPCIEHDDCILNPDLGHACERDR